MKLVNTSRIMVVDDDVDLDETYKLILEDIGFNVETFNNPFEALECFRQKPENTFDLMLIDMVMPGMNGAELYREMMNSNKKMPNVCFITGLPTYYDILKDSFPEIKVRCFIRKPIDKNELIIHVKQEMNK